MVLTYELSIIELMDAARDGDIAAIQEWFSTVTAGGARGAIPTKSILVNK